MHEKLDVESTGEQYYICNVNSITQSDNLIARI
jgi:hypothetical protein